jgi:hypothetical protein
MKNKIEKYIKSWDIFETSTFFRFKKKKYY